MDSPRFEKTLHSRRPGRVAVGASLVLLAMAGGAFAQSPAMLSEPPKTWAVETAANEILVIQHPDSFLRYHMHVVDEKGDQLRDQIETRDGSVARLIGRNGRPITPEEDAAERDRLKDLLDSPAMFARHVEKERGNKKLGADLLKLMPDAMIWSYAPGQPQSGLNRSGSNEGSPEVVLDFKPDPNWSPPTMASEPLTGLAGRVWIDPRSHRMVRLDGELFHAVNLGWGMLAHIYPGGKVHLEQTNAGGERWIVEHIVENLTVRAVMVKTVRQRLVFDTSSFQTVKPMSYQDAIKLLLETPLPAQ